MLATRAEKAQKKKKKKEKKKNRVANFVSENELAPLRDTVFFSLSKNVCVQRCDCPAVFRSGVFYDPNCSNVTADHAVLVVGYGTDSATGLDYWLVKNRYSIFASF